MFKNFFNFFKVKEGFNKDKLYTQDEIDKMNYNNTILIINGKIYDVTDFLEQHPGGSEIIKQYHKKDATQDFIKVGHSNEAIKMLDKYQIGILKNYNDNSLEIKKMNPLEKLKQKLFTHEDKYYLHKFFAMMVLIHIFIVYGHTIKKAFKYHSTGDDKILGEEALGFNSKIFFLFCHSVLALSSLIFHVPEKPSQEGPMINKMYRLHAINFSFRPILSMLILLLIKDKYNEKFLRIFIIIIALINADLISFYSYKNKNKNQFTSVNSMIISKFNEYEKYLKIFYGISQFLATIVTLQGTYYDIFTNLTVIQIAAFLSTLRRKNLITTDIYHYVYIFLLINPYIFIPYFNKKENRKIFPYHILIGVFLYFLRRQKINKYYIWFPVLFYYLYLENPKSNTNITVVIIMLLILILLKTKKNIFFPTRKIYNNVVLKNKIITENSFELILRTRKPINLKPGQHILIKYNEDLVRKYTPIDSNFDKKVNQTILTLRIKKYKIINNKLNMSTYLSKLKENQTLNLTGPFGSKYYENNMIVDEIKSKKYDINNEKIILFSAGSGITPIYQLVKNILPNIKNNLTLVTCDRNESDIMIKNELEELENKYKNLNWIKFLSQQNGRIKDEDIINLTKDKTLVVICGPDKWNKLFSNKNYNLIIW